MNSSVSSIWDQYRQRGGAGDETTLSVDTTEASGDDPHTIVIPAGVDPGKFLEESLRMRRNNRIGPKLVSNGYYIGDDYGSPCSKIQIFCRIYYVLSPFILDLRRRSRRLFGFGRGRLRLCHLQEGHLHP